MISFNGNIYTIEYLEEKGKNENHTFRTLDLGQGF